MFDYQEIALCERYLAALVMRLQMTSCKSYAPSKFLHINVIQTITTLAAFPLNRFVWLRRQYVAYSMSYLMLFVSRVYPFPELRYFCFSEGSSRSEVAIYTAENGVLNVALDDLKSIIPTDGPERVNRALCTRNAWYFAVGKPNKTT